MGLNKPTDLNLMEENEYYDSAGNNRRCVENSRDIDFFQKNEL